MNGSVGFWRCQKFLCQIFNLHLRAVVPKKRGEVQCNPFSNCWYSAQDIQTQHKSNTNTLKCNTNLIQIQWNTTQKQHKLNKLYATQISHKYNETQHKSKTNTTKMQHKYETNTMKYNTKATQIESNATQIWDKYKQNQAQCQRPGQKTRLEMNFPKNWWHAPCVKSYDCSRTIFEWTSGSSHKYCYYINVTGVKEEVP